MSLTPQGIQIRRLDEIIAKLQDGFRSIYGQDIDVAPDSPDGQMIGLFSQAIADLEELALLTWQQLDPDIATGVYLEQRVAYAGLTRGQAEYSYLRAVHLAGKPGTRIPGGAQLSDTAGQLWQLSADVTIGTNGTAAVDLRSVNLGSFFESANTALTIRTIVLGWQSATTRHEAEVGDEEETDPQLRYRFFRSRARASQNCVEGMAAKLLELDNVEEVRILENWTGVTDAHGVPGHSLNVIVDGGSIPEIAQVIWNDKTAGTGLMGQVAAEITDRYQILRPIRFDRPATIQCAADIELRRKEGVTDVDVDGVRQALAVAVFGIGEDVYLSRLYSVINAIPGHWVSSLRIGRVGQGLAADNVAIGVREKGRFAASDIAVRLA